MSEENALNKQALTRMLQASQAGDKEAVNALFPLVYDEMRKIAHHKLRFERTGHTLDTTALVHEAYFKLIDHDRVEWQSRAHFIGVAALAMKRILINYAEQKKAVKRGGDFSRVEVDELEDTSHNWMSDARADDILFLNSALERMKEFNQRGSLVVEYHFFGGLTWNDISNIMGIAPITVRRAWYGAQLWLRRELNSNSLNGYSAGNREV